MNNPNWCSDLEDARFGTSKTVLHQLYLAEAPPCLVEASTHWNGQAWQARAVDTVHAWLEPDYECL